MSEHEDREPHEDDENSHETSTALVPVERPTHAVTPAQAKVEAVATLTLAAYQKASTLQLTTDEIDRLKADFSDDCFRYGAAGKKNLIFIEHASLRDRLNTVIGIGQWALIPRSRWADEREYTDDGGTKRSMVIVYVEAMLLVRGCFVSESVGDMTYYPHNGQTNYGDAVEGAKTQALRRCCKEFGIGLQAWKKDWCEEWKRLNPENGKRQQQTQQAKPVQQPKPAPPPVSTGDEHLDKINAIKSIVNLDKWRQWALGKDTKYAEAVTNRAGNLLLFAASEAKSPGDADEVEDIMAEAKWGLGATHWNRDIKAALANKRATFPKQPA